MSSSKKTALFAVLCLLSLPVFYFSFRFAMADIAAYSVKYAVEDMDSGKALMTLETVDAAEEKIDSAIGWWPQNAEYVELKARLQLYRAIMGFGTPVFLSSVNNALALHQEAIELRPHWPYSWASRSLVKAYLGEFDAVYFEGFKEASRLGPWELSVNLSLLEAGLIGWQRLDESTISLVVAAAERGAEHRPKSVAELLNRYSMKYPICARMSRGEQQVKACR